MAIPAYPGDIAAGYALRSDVNSRFSTLYNYLQTIQFPSGGTLPASPSTGQVYFNTTSSRVNVYDGTGWHEYTRIDSAETITGAWTFNNATTTVASGKTLAMSGAHISGGPTFDQSPTFTAGFTAGANSTISASSGVTLQIQSSSTGNAALQLVTSGNEFYAIVADRTANNLTFEGGAYNFLVLSPVNGAMYSTNNTLDDGSGNPTFVGYTSSFGGNSGTGSASGIVQVRGDANGGAFVDFYRGGTFRYRVGAWTDGALHIENNVFTDLFTVDGSGNVTVGQNAGANFTGHANTYGHSGLFPCVISTNGTAGASVAQKVQYGQTGVSVGTVNTAASVGITFAVSFAAAPYVYASIASYSGSANAVRWVAATGISASGCTITAYSSLVENFTVFWYAIGH